MTDSIEKIFEGLTPAEQHRLAAQVAGNYPVSQPTEDVEELVERVTATVIDEAKEYAANGCNVELAKDYLTDLLAIIDRLKGGKV